MKILNKMQRRESIWILGAFKMSPSEGIENFTCKNSLKDTLSVSSNFWLITSLET